MKISMPEYLRAFPLWMVFGVTAVGGLSACGSHQHRPCADISIPGKTVDFTASELKLLCGDPTNPDWNAIPREQVIYSLKTFLLQRGYYKPDVREAPQSLFFGPRSPHAG